VPCRAGCDDEAAAFRKMKRVGGGGGAGGSKQNQNSAFIKSSQKTTRTMMTHSFAFLQHVCGATGEREVEVSRGEGGRWWSKGGGMIYTTSDVALLANMQGAIVQIRGLKNPQCVYLCLFHNGST
jgi:hypothetical protein